MNVIHRFAAAVRPINGIIARGLRSDLKITWKRPELLSSTGTARSGDLKPLEKPDPNQLMKGFEKSKELENAEERLKKLFIIDNNRRKEMFTLYRTEMTKKVQRHEQDFYSTEARIAYQTAKIRSLQERFEKNPRDKRLKVFLKQMIEKRTRRLKMLRRHDYKRYEYILEKLDLVYKPQPVQLFRIERKASLRKLTTLHCEEIKQQRLDAYRKELESKQLEFLEKKYKNLDFIRKEQIACQVKVTVTDEDVKQAKAQYEAMLAEKKKLQEAEEEKQRIEM